VPGSRSNSARQQQDDKDDNDDADDADTAVSVAVTVAAEAAAEAAEQEDDEDDDEYQSKRHVLFPLAKRESPERAPRGFQSYQQRSERLCNIDHFGGRLAREADRPSANGCNHSVRELHGNQSWLV
jgi:hypothetical protein